MWLDVIVKLFIFFTFFHIVNLIIFHTQYRQGLPREHNASYNFILIFLQLCKCFLHSLCMAFHIILAIFFCHFFVLFDRIVMKL